MDEQTLDDNNELIALFDDWTLETELETKVQFFMKGRRKIYHYDLEYHSSWNWLMSVIQKIRNDHKVDIYFKADCTECHIVCIRGIYTIVVSGSVTEPILPVYDAVCKFIKWYSEYRTKRAADNTADTH